MDVQMSNQTAPMSECLITDITNIRLLTTMYAVMCYQIALLTKCLSTHITNIWTLTTMYVFM